MGNELNEWIKAVVAGAVKGLTPPEESARVPARPADEIGRGVARAPGRFDSIVILCDVSKSMNQPAGGRRKVEHLREALLAVFPTVPSAHLIAFASIPTELLGPSYLPNPDGGTALHLGLEAAAAHRPSKTVVISDGRPDSESRALEAAALLSGTIDVIYCGPASDRQAIDFMNRLARLGGGRAVVHDLRTVDASDRQLASTLKALVSPQHPPK